ncbi:MAG: ribonuclease P protein component [Chitinophagales bacterium]|nr:ribonuclease P protein component [Chitinophagales bacterium]
MRRTLSKKERLHSKKLIDELFSDSSSFYFYPFKINYLKKSENAQFSVQVLISVSKKNFKRAVDRNSIKRRVREAYRINKQLLYSSLKKNNQQLLIGYIYVSRKMEPFALIQDSVLKIIERISSLYGIPEKNPE